MKITTNLPNSWLDPIESAKNERTAPASKAADTKPSQTEFPADRFEVRNTSTDDIRADKVQALQRAIASGQYQVSSEDLADAMLRDWQG